MHFAGKKIIASLALYVVIALMSCAVGAGEQGEPGQAVHTLEGSAKVPDTMELTGVLDRFTPDSSGLWKFSSGKNLRHVETFGFQPAQFNQPLLRIRIDRKDEGNKKPNENYFNFSRIFTPEKKWKDARALRLVIGFRERTKTWAKIVIGTSRGKFAKELRPYEYPARTLVDRVFEFDGMKNNAGSRPLGNEINYIQIQMFGSTNTVYLNEIQLVRPGPQRLRERR